MMTPMRRPAATALPAGLFALACFALAPASAETLTSRIESVPLTLSNPCAVFNTSTSDPNIVRISYGEPVSLTLDGQVLALLNISDSGQLNLKFQVTAHGQGAGQTSLVDYVMNAKAQLKANGDLTAPLDRFSGRFRLDARLIGQGRVGDTTGIAQGAQDNAVLSFDLDVRLANGELRSAASNFSIACQGSPWNNEMTARNSVTRQPVERGFGDPWNKYSWSMKEFNGGMIVGTKNAYFDPLTAIGIFTSSGSDSPAKACFDDVTNPLPSIYRALGCMELYDSGSEGVTSGSAQTRGAELWRHDYKGKTWTRVRDEAPEAGQGYRVMATHAGRLYAGSDLGAFISGVKLGSWNGIDPYAPAPPDAAADPSAPEWTFPGSRVLATADGRNWSEVASCNPNAPQPNPCNEASGVTSAGVTNISIRALASYGGLLYVGTFNNTGGELWSYNAATEVWAPIQKFAPAAEPYALICSSLLWSGKCAGIYSPAVTELAVYGGKLLIGLGGPGNQYLWSYSGSGAPAVVSGLPEVKGDTLGVLKLFVSSKGQLFVGLVNLSSGFELLTTASPDAPLEAVTTDGFGNSSNAYAWSMAELNGRVFLGTFNSNFFETLPRGSAELWYSDDATNWQQHALPLGWGLWNYGIRTMEVGNRQLWLGSASNMVAPDLTLLEDGTALSPGTEVWTVKATAVSSPSNTKPAGRK